MSAIATELRSRAERYADRIAIKQSGHGYRYRDFLCAIDRAAAGLAANLRSERVMLQSRNRYECLVLFYALLQAGAVPFLYDGDWSAEQLRALSQRYGVRWIMTTNVEGFESEARQDTERMPETGGYRLIGLEGEPAGRPIPSGHFVRFTSGSTGMPKAVLFSETRALAIAREWAAAAELGTTDTVLCYAALNNGLAFNTSLLAVFVQGATLVLHDGPILPGALARSLVEAEPTIIVAFPFIYELLIGRLKNLDPACKSRIRYGISSAASLPDKVKQGWNDAFGRAVIGNYYGVAEVGPVSFNDGRDQSGVGKALPGVRLDNTGEKTLLTTHWSGINYLSGFDAGDTTDWGIAGFPCNDRIALDADGTIRLLGRSDNILNLQGKKYDLDTESRRLTELLGFELLLIPKHRDEKVFVVAVSERTGDARDDDLVPRVNRLLAGGLVVNKHVSVDRFPRSSAGKILVSQLSTSV